MNEDIHNQVSFLQMSTQQQMDIINVLRAARVTLKAEALIIRRAKKKGTVVSGRKKQKRKTKKDEFMNQLPPDKRAIFASLSPKMQRMLMR